MPNSFVLSLHTHTFLPLSLSLTHAHTHACMHARTHTCTHACTHTHTHSLSLSSVCLFCLSVSLSLPVSLMCLICVLCCDMNRPQGSQRHAKGDNHQEPQSREGGAAPPPPSLRRKRPKRRRFLVPMMTHCLPLSTSPLQGQCLWICWSRACVSRSVVLVVLY